MFRGGIPFVHYIDCKRRSVVRGMLKKTKKREPVLVGLGWFLTFRKGGDLLNSPSVVE